MALILRDGTALLHVPRTGGTWARDVLTASGIAHQALGAEHLDLAGLRAVLPDAPVVVAVRHPLRWWPSAWAAGLTWLGFGITTAQPFPEFAARVAQEHPGGCSALKATSAWPRLCGELAALLPGSKLMAFGDLADGPVDPAKLAEEFSAAIVVPRKDQDRRWVGATARREAQAFAAADKPVAVFASGELVPWSECQVSRRADAPGWHPFEIVLP